MKIKRVFWVILLSWSFSRPGSGSTVVHDPIHTVLNVAQQVYGQVRQEAQLRMEFRRFLHLIVMLPAQIVRPADYLPDHGLQRLAQRLLRYLGISSPNGT